MIINQISVGYFILLCNFGTTEVICNVIFCQNCHLKSFLLIEMFIDGCKTFDELEEEKG